MDGPPGGGGVAGAPAGAAVKAVLAHAPGRFEYADVPEPVPAPGTRVLRVEAAGVCAADRMLWHGTGPWQVGWPFVPGHELLGRDVVTGERLTAEVSLPCGCCRHCRGSHGNLCRQARHIGSDLPGGFAEWVALPAGTRVHLVPDSLPPAAAVLAEPMACAVHAVRRAGVGPGDTVAVIGLGAVGALAVLAARARSAERVLALVRSGPKAELARLLGAEPVAVPAGDDAAGAGLDACADAVIECSGDPAAAALALRLAAPGGRVCFYSVYPSSATVDLNLISEFKELTVSGGHLAPGCFPEAISLLATMPAELQASQLPLAEFERALQAPPYPRVKAALVP